MLVAPQLSDAPRGAALLQALDAAHVEVAEVGPLELASAAETESPQGVLALAEIPAGRLSVLTPPPGARVVVLDAVQDPGNAGTIVRTAAALGAAAVVALPGTVDVWNAKVVRSAMGASFHVPTIRSDWDELAAWCAEHDVALWGADAAGVPVDSIVVPPRLALVVGNEGSGLSAESRQRCARLLSLPVAPAVESLNVAVATGILLYQLRP